MTDKIIYRALNARFARPAEAEGTPVLVVFAYDPDDPLAVTLSFYSGPDEPAVWVVSRDVLGDGLAMHSGLADVTAWPGETGTYCLAIDGGRGQAEFRFDIGEVERFLYRTFRAVPQSTESYDVDAGLAQLLRDEAA